VKSRRASFLSPFIEALLDALASTAGSEGEAE
jgi:hypothetical protein